MNLVQLRNTLQFHVGRYKQLILSGCFVSLDSLYTCEYCGELFYNWLNEYCQLCKLKDCPQKVQLSICTVGERTICCECYSYQPGQTQDGIYSSEIHNLMVIKRRYKTLLKKNTHYKYEKCEDCKEIYYDCVNKSGLAYNIDVGPCIYCIKNLCVLCKTKHVCKYLNKNFSSLPNLLGV